MTEERKQARVKKRREQYGRKEGRRGTKGRKKEGRNGGIKEGQRKEARGKKGR
jgi:hypothetical protein